MNPITHALVGWCVAETVPRVDWRGRAIVVAAAVAPDLDGFGLPFELATRDTATPLLWWSEYHHALGHNLTFAVVVAAVSAVISRAQRALVACLAFLSFHLHLLGDLAGSRGPDGYEWPIPYLAPFSKSGELTWSGQWALNAWPNVAITIALLIAAFVLAWSRGYSPVGLFSRRADAAFIATLRNRFPRRKTERARG